MIDHRTKDTATMQVEEIATSNDSVYTAVLDGTLEAMSDLVERVADTGADCLEREVEFAGQTWVVTVKVKAA